MGSVQFFGKQAIVAAYERRGIPVWALFDGKQMLNAGDTAEELAEEIDNLGTGGIYVLRFYQDEENSDLVRSATEYTSCYKVKIADSISMAGMGVARGTADPVTAKVNEWVAKRVGEVITRDLEGSDDDEKEETIGDLLKGWLKDPNKIIGVIAGVKSLLSGSGPAPMAVAGVANVTRAGGAVSAAPAPAAGHRPPTDDETTRLGAALDILGKHDPDIILHLEQLAVIARDKPDIYKMALNFLK